MRYFAYGSNMSLRRLRARVPSAHRVAMCSLQGHVLRFHKRGRDGSGKCDIVPTAQITDRVIGVLYSIAEAEKVGLDRAEGLGRGYEETCVTVADPDGHSLAAFTYRATDTADDLTPFSWYLNHVLVGAREAGLPREYVARLERVHCIADEVLERDRAERAIYGRR